MDKTKAAAAVPVAKMDSSDGATARRPRKQSCGGDLVSHGGLTLTAGHQDLISKLPDDILRSIISLLPVKDGARTQAFARRWRPLWRPAPLALDSYRLCSDEFKRLSVVSRILSDHHGPARRFVFYSVRLHRDEERFAAEAAQIESWFRSRALDGLQDLQISFEPLDYARGFQKRYPLPPSVFRCASTLVSARIQVCDFPREIPRCVSFPFLKQLKLYNVSIAVDVFHVVLSRCHVLESLSLEGIHGVGCFRISCPTLRSISLCASTLGKGDWVIDDAPLLERLLLPFSSQGGDTIRVIKAPKLEILGLLSPRTSEVQIGNLLFKWMKYSGIPMNNAPPYDLLVPIKCLETHLKELVLMFYEGSTQYISFAKFFVLNAKVLKQIKFRVKDKVNKEWVVDQHRLLEAATRASPDAQLEFIRCNSKGLDAHDLSTADPFTCYVSNEIDALS